MRDAQCQVPTGIAHVARALVLALALAALPHFAAV